MGKQKNGISLWHSCFGRCAKVEDEPSPVDSPGTSTPMKIRQKSSTRLSWSDVSHTELSSLSSSLLGANLYVFTVQELKTATQGFSSTNFIGEGGFGPVYKGYIDDKIKASGIKPQTVAVKVLDLDGMQGHKEWLTEVLLLGQLRHPHLVKLIGYCYEDKHRMLVYEFMARGSLENHLFKRYDALSWENRMKIAMGAAKGLEFLHGVDQPVIYRDFKASNILLDSEFKAKLSDFGLAKDGPEGDDTHVSTRVMGTHGYAAPEYIMTGHLTAKSDVYSFGVVLLELLTGRRSVDKMRPSREQNLVDWGKPYLNNPRRVSQIIDPRLEGQYSTMGAVKAAELAYHCLNHLPKSRPDMCKVVELLEPILQYKDIPPGTFVFTIKEETKKTADNNIDNQKKDHNLDQPVSIKDDDLKLFHHDVPKRKNNAARQNRRRRNEVNKRKPSSKAATVYSDTALYRKSPKKIHARGI